MPRDTPLPAEQMTALLTRYVPPAAVAYCLELWQQHSFTFKPTHQRKTKHGDYRYYPNQRVSVITVNTTLNCYAFLITYVHEVAHLVAFERYGHRIAPHGKAWQQRFRQLMHPVLNAHTFPADVLAVLTRHMQRPRASSSADPALMLALHAYDPPAGTVALASVPLKQAFCFHRRIFVKDEVKRTRAWCTEVKSGKRYTIPIVALVELAS